MKQASLQFRNAIRDRTREMDTRVIFYIGDNKYVIKGKDIQSIKYNASAERELGAIEKKIATITLIKNNITDKLNKGSVILRETWIKYNGNWISDFQEKLIVISKKESDGGKIFKLEAVDELTIKRDENSPNLSQQMDVSLLIYFERLVQALTDTYTMDDGLVNPLLDLAFIKSSKLHETLLEMAIATQSLIKTDFNIVKYVKKNVVDRLDYTTGLLEVTIDDDDTESYDRVDVSIFSPTSEVFKRIGGLRANIPPSARKYNIGKVGFDKIYIPQLMIFSDQITIDDYKISSSECELTVSTSMNNELSLSVEFYGLDINAINTTKSDNKNKTKIIHNMYIQSPGIYDTKIYKGRAVTIKYAGNTTYEVGDCILVDGKHEVFILEHDLTYDGSLRGIIKGVIM